MCAWPLGGLCAATDQNLNIFPKVFRMDPKVNMAVTITSFQTIRGGWKTGSAVKSRFSARSEDPGSTPSSHMVAHNHL